MNSLTSHLSPEEEQKLAKLGEYQQAVLRLLLEVPRGKVTTYGGIAKALAKRTTRWSPKAARAVGTAMKNNPCAPKIPCHRVIKSDGSLGNFMGGAPEGAKRKRVILEREGVVVKKGKINLEKFGYFF